MPGGSRSSLAPWSVTPERVSRPPGCSFSTSRTGWTGPVMPTQRRGRRCSGDAGPLQGTMPGRNGSSAPAPGRPCTAWPCCGTSVFSTRISSFFMKTWISAFGRSFGDTGASSFPARWCITAGRPPSVVTRLSRFSTATGTWSGSTVRTCPGGCCFRLSFSTSSMIYYLFYTSFPEGAGRFSRGPSSRPSKGGGKHGRKGGRSRG